MKRITILLIIGFCCLCGCKDNAKLTAYDHLQKGDVWYYREGTFECWYEIIEGPNEQGLVTFWRSADNKTSEAPFEWFKEGRQLTKMRENKQ